MSTTLETKLRVGAAAYAPLTALLGTAPLRWYDVRLNQGSTYPAVTVKLVSSAEDYAVNGRFKTGWSRVQFDIWDTDPESGRAVESALMTFLDQFNAIGISGLSQYPCHVVNVRQSDYPIPAPLRFVITVDAQIFSNNSL